MKYLFLLGCSLAASVPAMAQDIVAAPSIRDDQITVIATGSRQPVDQSGQSISVIGAGEIASVQGPDLTRVLERLPGITFSRNGGLGGFTGVRVRGAEAEQLLVLVDGVRVADVAAPGSGFDFGNLLSGSIEKIELLRGSNSIIWGSDAIGGAMAITTRQIEGVEAAMEYGANNTLYAMASGGFRRGGSTASLSVGFHDSDGISSFATGAEPDGLRQWQVTGKFRQDLGNGFVVTANGRYADGRLDIDGFPPPSFAVFGDTLETQKTREISGRVGAEFKGDALWLNAAFAVSDVRRAFYDPAFGGDTTFDSVGRSHRAELIGAWSFSDHLTLNFGADSEWTRFSTKFDPQADARLSSVHALLDYHSDRLSLAAGVRYDNHDRFGGSWTFGANGTYRIVDDWRIRASYGEGFKAPTLYQAYSFIGNRQLRPERSQSFDFGIEKGDRNDALHFAASLFRRDSFDLIQFFPCIVCAGFSPGNYDNIGLARAEGVELEGDVRPTKRLQLHAAYSYVKSVNRTAVVPFSGNFFFGKDLARRPRHAITVAVDWRSPLHDLALGADLRTVSDSFDDAGNFTRLRGYTLLALRASLPVTDRIELYGRVENLTDAVYLTAATYGTPGRSAYAGVRARF